MTAVSKNAQKSNIKTQVHPIASILSVINNTYWADTVLGVLHRTSYNPHSRGLNIDQDGLPRQNHGPVDKSKLAVNSDGTPMIF